MKHTRWILLAALLAFGMAAGVAVAALTGESGGDDAASCDRVRSEFGHAVQDREPQGELGGGLFRGISADDAQRCAVLQGLKRSEVAFAMGGPQHRRERDDKSWLYVVGETDDTYGPGDAVYFSVRFGPSTNRVVRTTFSG